MDVVVGLDVIVVGGDFVSYEYFEFGRAIG